VAERDRTNSDCEVTIKFSVGDSLRGREHYAAGIVLGRTLKVDRVTFKALRHEPEELTQYDKRVEANFLRDQIHIARADDLVSSWIIPIPFEKVPQCWLNPLHTVMDWQGNIYICCFYYYRWDSHRIGNIFEKPFREIWMSAEHREKIRQIKREACNLVDCKFVLHDQAVQDFEKGKRGYFL
jgi:radical SAM protein with 4Fe4S-binding SPASM domain